MQKIESIFTKAKAWQLFLLLFAIPMVIQFSVMSYFMPDFTSAEGNQNQAREAFERLTNVFGVLTFVFALLLVGWLYFSGIAANRRLKESTRKRTYMFRFSAIYPIIYVVLYFVVFIRSFTGDPSIGMVPIIIPLHFLAMICMVYLLYFASKNLSMSLKEKGITSGGTAGFFFGFWFYPIGVWFIQPKVNRLVNQEGA